MSIQISPNLSPSASDQALADDFARIDEEAKERRKELEKQQREKALSLSIPLGVGDEPSPLPFHVEGWLPRGYATMLFGHGGTGKSYVALYLAFCTVLGRSFFGRAVKRGNVLWFDAEDLGKEEVERRSWQVARGMGLERPPEGIYYYTVRRSVNDPAVSKTIRAIVDARSISLVVLDSLSAGSIGLDLSAADDMVKLMRGLNAWNSTILVLDHVSKRAASGESPATAFGSAFKHNLVRSSLGLSHAKGAKGTLQIDHHKANFCARSEPVFYEMTFTEDEDGSRPTVCFEKRDPPETTREEKVPAKTLTLHALREAHSRTGQPVTLQHLAEERGLASKTISNHLSALSGDGLASSESGAWAPTPTE